MYSLGLDYRGVLLKNYNVKSLIVFYSLQYHIGMTQIGKYLFFIEEFNALFEFRLYGVLLTKL